MDKKIIVFVTDGDGDQPWVSGGDSTHLILTGALDRLLQHEGYDVRMVLPEDAEGILLDIGHLYKLAA
jgi:hypothetical protein